ncbi:caspase-14-like isoform X1 [Polyodon spathula]|uniref:caspase-14-like isoform X1 n=1 Tax=Polyodon spathula TaxID=7913 RepID=UPI001B7F4312|nr:caspase-14-like isoform X1 [Polyodon spathula]
MGSREELSDKFSPLSIASPDEDRYDMGGKRKALMMCVRKNREGAEQDVAMMRRLFLNNKFQFHCAEGSDPTAEEILKTVKNFRDEINNSKENISCCFVITASHGDLGAIYGSDSERVELNSIFKLFRNDQCPKLQSKPKVFIIQACRGTQRDLGVNRNAAPCYDSRGPSLSPFKPVVVHDMLTVYAQQPGYVAFRSTRAGSLLFQEMEGVFKEYAGSCHLFDLFTKVNQKLVQLNIRVLKKGAETKKKDDYEAAKETLLIESTLKKLLYLNS